MRFAVPFFVLLACFVSLNYAFVSSYSQPLFPLHAAIFLPHDVRDVPSNESGTSEKYLATIESIRPIIDIALVDAHKNYLAGWAPPYWLEIYDAPIKACDNQETAAWAALRAHDWTNGSGLDLVFGPGCDYVLATIARILSYYSVPIFTNAASSEYFDKKENMLLTRIGPLQNQITMFFNQIALNFEWKNPQILYEKSFWHSELLEGSFCKLLMNGMYVWTKEKKWNMTVNPRILPSFDDFEGSRNIFYRKFLETNIGVDYGG